MRRSLLSLAAAGTLGLAALTPVGGAHAQDEESGRFVRFVERQISTPDRRIDIGPIDGALSSDVRIGYITIADRQGVWLTIEDVHLVWSRLALVRGRLDVDLLEAASITIARPPLPAETDEPLEPGAEAFTLPDLPVAVLLDRLNVPRVEIAEGVIGPAAALGVDGSITLDDGELDTELAINRLDRPGDLTLSAEFSSDSRRLAIDFALSEPADGVIANALSVEGRPPISFTIAGEGELEDFIADISLVADGETLVSGSTEIDSTGEGLRFVADVSGNLDPLVPELYDPLVGEGTALRVDVTRAESGAISIAEGRLTSGAADLTFSGELGADYVPTALTVEGRLEREDGAPLALPFGGARNTVRAATLSVAIGGAEDELSARFALTDLDTSLLMSPEVTLVAEGTAANLAEPAAREIALMVTGEGEDISSANAALGQAIGRSLSLSAGVRWQAGEPVSVTDALLTTDTLATGFSGTVGDALAGDFRLEAAELAAFRELVGQPLGGSVDLQASGRVGFGGTFDVTLDGTAENLVVGPVDGLLDGRTVLRGRAARTDEGVLFDDFALENPQLTLLADGEATPARADLQARVDVADLSGADARLDGALNAVVTVAGDPAAPQITAALASPALSIEGQRFDDLQASFDGTFTREGEQPFDLDGRFSVGGRVDGAPLDISATLVTGPDARALEDLSLSVAGASASGTLARQRDGLFTGNLDVDVPDLSRLAALALTEAQGAVDATLVLSASEARQVAAVDGTVSDLAVAGIAVGAADLDLVVEDVFGLPIPEGRAQVRDVAAGEVRLASADLIATRAGDTASVALEADLTTGTVSAEGTVSRRPDRFAATLSAFQLARDGFAATLLTPTSVEVSGQQITIGDTRLTVGEGAVIVEGTVGDTFDLTAEVRDLPLTIANLVRPQLEAAGTVSGRARIEGTRVSPQVDASVVAEGVTLSLLAERGIEPLTVEAAGQYADGTLTLQRFATEIAGGTLSAAGTVGTTLDLTVSADALPLALANAARPDLDLSGEVSGEAVVSGTRLAPAATFDVRVAEASAAPLRAANLPPIDAEARGTYADGAATLELLRTTIGGGLVEARGTVGETLDVTATVRDLPLALANAVRPDLGLSGTVAGTVTAEGPLADPTARFDVTVADATAAALPAGIDPLDATVTGTFADGSATLSEARVSVGGGSLVAQGTVGQTLDLTATIAQLPLSLANTVRPELGLSGTLDGTITAEGSLADPTARFDVRVTDALAAALPAGIDPLDATATGTFADGSATLERAEVSVGGGSLVAQGTVGQTLDLTATIEQLPLSLANTVRPELGLSGTLDGTIAAEGSLADPTARFDVTVTDALAAALPAGIDPLDATVTGTFADGTATLERAEVSVGGGSLVAEGTVGETLDLAVTLAELPLSLANTVRPELALTGTVSGTARATGSLNAPDARFDLRVADARSALLPADLAALNATLAGTFSGGTLTLEDAQVAVGGGTLAASGTVGRALDLAVRIDALPLALADAVRPDLGLSGTLSGTAAVDGPLADPTATFDLNVANASARLLDGAGVGTVAATLAGTYANGVATLETATATLGGGRITVEGRVGPQLLDLDASVEAFPLGVVNAFRPELAVSGTLSGRVRATGTPSDPRVRFDIEAPAIDLAPLRDAGLPDARVRAAGRYEGGTATLEEAVLSVGGASATVTGRIGRTLDVDARLSAVPLAFANAIAPGLGLSGTLSGTVAASGSLADPRATFDLAATGVSANPLRDAGVGPLAVVASGSFAGDTVTLASARATGDGLALTASGRVPLSGGGLDVTADATLPLALANRALAGRGASVEGVAQANVRVTGSLSDPRVAGRITASGVTVRDPQTNLVLSGLAVSATLDGERVVLERLTATLGEGTIAVTGSIGLGAGFPADLRVVANDARYADGRLLAVTFDADLAVTGPLTRGPVVIGRVAVERAEITVPTRLSGTAALLEVTHFNTPPDVLETLRRADAGPFADRPVEGGSGATGLILDVTIDAPNQVFIRGRGVDAELGGQVRITGPISDVSPVGEFDLIRGRIVILSQRIVLTEGNVTLFGDLNPFLRLVAETESANDVTVRVTLEGRASDPSISFESVPDLPQDEVLAQLIFGRSVEDLSAFQLAQLAAAVAELAGTGSGPSIIDQVRIISGLDNLELVTTPSGGTAVEAGRYIADNVYVGVRAGPESTGVTVNLDITRGLKARAEAFSDEAAIGLYYEREY